MKILHISASNKNSGAGSAALKIHDALLIAGISSKILFLTGAEDVKKNTYVFANTFFNKIRRFVNTHLDRLFLLFYPNKSNQVLFSPGLIGDQIADHKLVQWADVIHLHWINHGFVQVLDIKKMCKPTIVTMHDMWGFTGGCHYSFGCTKYVNTCGMCPVLNSKSNQDLAYFGWRNKEKAYRYNRINWVAISSWMQEQASKSSLLNGKSVSVIPSGIDTSVFQVKSKDYCKSMLKFKTDKRIILLGAENIHNPSKGGQIALNALKMMPFKNQYIIVTFGKGTIDGHDIDIETINMGFISKPEIIALLYGAADVFVAPSVAEAFGMTLAEAQCCGTPVVAFNNMGPKDIVQHGVTGYLVDDINGEALLAGLMRCLNSDFNPFLISDRASALFGIAHCAQQYSDLYQQIIKQFN